MPTQVPKNKVYFKVMTQTWQQRIIGIWYKKDASLGVEGVINKIYYSKPFVFVEAGLNDE